jgi:hypothetical protein
VFMYNDEANQNTVISLILSSLIASNSIQNSHAMKHTQFSIKNDQECEHKTIIIRVEPSSILQTSMAEQG